MKGSDFVNINMRAREAFIIACIENAVQHEGLTHPRWQVLINGLWSMLGNYFFTDLEEYLSDRCPGMIELFESYDDFILDSNPPIGPFPLTEIEFIEYKEIFSAPSTAAVLLEHLNDFTPSGVYGAHDPERDYRILDRCIMLLNSHNIPLPPFENFVPFVWDDANTHGGSYRRQDFFKASEDNDGRDRKPFKWFGFFRKR
jgi:hypothetical protein